MNDQCFEGSQSVFGAPGHVKNVQAAWTAGRESRGVGRSARPSGASTGSGLESPDQTQERHMAVVRDLLARKGTDVVSIAPTATVLDAARLMNDRSVGGVLVVDAENHLLGI